MSKTSDTIHMRLDKYLSHTTGLSRSLSKRAIQKHGVLVNGKICTDPGAIVHADDQISYLGRTLEFKGARYIMLNKPVVEFVTDSGCIHHTG